MKRKSKVQQQREQEIRDRRWLQMQSVSLVKNREQIELERDVAMERCACGDRAVTVKPNGRKACRVHA